MDIFKNLYENFLRGVFSVLPVSKYSHGGAENPVFEPVENFSESFLVAALTSLDQFPFRLFIDTSLQSCTACLTSL